MASSCQSSFKLSICIATFNRSTLIGETLDSIIAQATTDCEIVVSDNASTDSTEEVVSGRARHFDRLRYFKQDSNKGLDRNFDCAVELARGEYCWLMSDDDLLNPGAVSSVLHALQGDFSLIAVNTQYMRFDMRGSPLARLFKISADRVYDPKDMDRLFVDVHGAVYLGSVVIRRSIWLARDRQRYYGSLFIQTGVIFQKPLPGRALAIAEPLTSYRCGNANEWPWSKTFEILMFTWPSLVWSLDLAESAKRKLCRREPWRSFGQLLLYRAWGCYSIDDYRRSIRPRLLSYWQALPSKLIALLPGAMINTLFLMYFWVTHKPLMMDAMTKSPFYLGNRWTTDQQRRRAIVSGTKS